jgi:hypothetical protein
VTRVEPAREARRVDPAVLGCLRARLQQERFAVSDSGGPFRAVYE